jgi:hypothetical protein
MTSGRVGVYADLPVDIVQYLDEEASKTAKSKWEILAESLELYFGIDPADDPDALERAICRIREDMNDIESSIDDLTDQLERKRSQVHMLESKREDIIDSRDSYVDLLDDRIGVVLELYAIHVFVRCVVHLLDIFPVGHAVDD